MRRCSWFCTCAHCALIASSCVVNLLYEQPDSATRARARTTDQLRSPASLFCISRLRHRATHHDLHAPIANPDSPAPGRAAAAAAAAAESAEPPPPNPPPPPPNRRRSRRRTRRRRTGRRRWSSRSTARRPSSARRRRRPAATSTMMMKMMKIDQREAESRGRRSTRPAAAAARPASVTPRPSAMRSMMRVVAGEQPGAVVAAAELPASIASRMVSPAKPSVMNCSRS